MILIKNKGCNESYSLFLFYKNMVIVTITLLSVLVVILSFTNYNMIKKNEKCEDIIKSYENYMVNLSNTIEFSEQKLKEIDSKGTFTGDDEVGYFFQQLKYLQKQLNNFKVK
jgi:predicted membrane protein